MYSQVQSERTLRARQLRAKGYSIRNIAKALNASKSSVHKWVRDIEKVDRQSGQSGQSGQVNGTKWTGKMDRVDRVDRVDRQAFKSNSELKGNRSHRKNYTLFSSVSGKRRTTGRTNGTNVRAGMICLVVLIVIIVFLLLFQDQIKSFLTFFSEDEETSKEEVSKEEDKSIGFEGRSIEDL